MGEAILKTGRTGGIEDRAVAETLAIRVYNYFIMSLIPGQVLPHDYFLKPSIDFCFFSRPS